MDMIEATCGELDKGKAMVERGRLRDEGRIGLRAGRILNKYKMAKHFKLDIREGRLSYEVDEESVCEESALDGVYVVRTSLGEDIMARDDVVRNYKRLTRVEQTFRSIKASGLEVRPISHYTEPRVRAHIFLCMLAEYVQWHMRRAWCEILFTEEVDTLEERDPVAPSEPTAQVRRKKARERTSDGLSIQSFRSLLKSLFSVVSNTCRTPTGETFEATTRPDPLQARALELLRACSQT